MSEMLRKIKAAVIAVITAAVFVMPFGGINALAADSPWSKTDQSGSSPSLSADKSDSASGKSENTSAAAVRLSKTSVKLTEGEKTSISLKGAEGTVRWSISDKDVFSYSKGVITAKKAGRAALTAEYNGKKYRCSVTVTAKENSSAASAGTYSLSLKKGESSRIKINNADTDVVVMTDNADVCCIKCGVISNGSFDLTVTAKAKGSCNIIVFDGITEEAKARIKVTVSWQSSGTDKPSSDSSGTVSAGMGTGDNANAADTDKSDYIDEVIRLCNVEREAAGLSPLEKSDSLTESAAVRAEEVTEKFSHTRPDGTSCFTAINVSSRASGENIAAGYSTPEQVVKGWMNSPGHRSNILSSKFTKIGVGYEEDGNYWVQLFIG
ncbi:MAG: CAP domain-containing protein [Ruminococcus sp.]|nr:CAP domain-containing protein [Ruminococcus sp.]